MNNQEIIVANEKEVLTAFATTDTPILYSSFPCETEEQKIILVNTVGEPTDRISDHINKTILFDNAYIEVVNLTSETTGGMNQAPRIVLYNSKTGKSYQCVSLGIFGTLQRIFKAFGDPMTWDKPIKVEVTQKTRGQNSILGLKVLPH